ncbi:MAG: hypothetical protein QW328_07175 [Nitrososphaerota archaeon]
MTVTEEAALLPFEEKARLIIELRKQGRTYREIAKALKVSPRDIKRALKLEAHKDEIQTLKSRVESVEKRLNGIEETLIWLESGLNRRFRKDEEMVQCVHMDKEGYCRGWFWKSPVKGWTMKSEGGKYYLNVDKHRWICTACPSFTPRSFEDKLEGLIKALKEVRTLLEMAAFKT